MAARARESRRFAFANGMQVESVSARLESGQRDGQFDALRAGHELHVVAARRLRRDFAQLDGSRDPFALDVRFGAQTLTCRRCTTDGDYEQRNRPNCSKLHVTTPFTEGL